MGQKDVKIVLQTYPERFFSAKDISSKVGCHTNQVRSIMKKLLIKQEVVQDDSSGIMRYAIIQTDKEWDTIIKELTKNKTITKHTNQTDLLLMMILKELRGEKWKKQ